MTAIPQEAPVPDLTVSLISADNLSLLLPCLESLFASTHEISLEVYLVDNASKDNTSEVVSQQFPQVTILRNERRLGFSTNNNMVLTRGKGRHLIILNDDTKLLEGALDKLVQFADAHPRAGAVGSALLNADGSPQAAFARFPHPLIEGFWPAAKWSKWLRNTDPQAFEVDSVCGAAMLVRREVLEQVGGLDTDFDPIYSEEIDWCYRIKKAGWRIYALPQSKVIHYGSQTMDRVVPEKYRLLLAHKALFFKKHGNRAAAPVYRAALWTATLLKVLWWEVQALLKPECARCDAKRRLHRYLLQQIRTF